MNPQTFDEWWRDGHSYLTRESAEAVFAETRALVAEIQKEVIPRARTEALREAADRVNECLIKELAKLGLPGVTDYAILGLLENVRAAILAGEVKE